MNGMNQFDLTKLDAESLTRLISELEQSKNDLEAKQSAERTLARFAKLMRWQTEDTLILWSERLLEELIASLNGLQGCIYMATGQNKMEKRLRRIGAYAMQEEELAVAEIAFGEGVVGQAAKSGRMTHFNQKSKIESRTHTGTAILHPRALVIMPLIYNEKVEGVLEISSTDEFTNETLAMLNNLSESMAANLMSIRSQDEMKRLFEEAQQKSEELLAQEEEMRQNVEELQATHEEMRRQQQEIMERESRLNAFINSSPDLILAIDRNRQVMIVNLSALQYYMERNIRIETNTTEIRDLIPAAQWAEFDRILKQAFEGDQVVQEMSWRDESGQNDFEFYLNPIFNAELQVYAVSIIRRDVSQRKKQEQIIAEKSANLSAIINNTDDIIVTIDPEYRITMFNESLTRAIAATGNDLLKVGASILQLVDPSMVESQKADYDRALKGEKFTTERDYGVVISENVYNPIWSEDGSRVTGVSIISRDITNRVKAERDRAERAGRLQNQERSMARLAKSEAITGGNLDAAFNEITSVLAETLNVGRVSIWMYDTKKKNIICHKLFLAADNSYSSGVELNSKDYPAYFKAIANETALAVTNAKNDPRTADFAQYLAENGIGAMLDIPIRRNGKMIGVICHEHLGESRNWEQDEQGFASTVAEMITLALEAYDRVQAFEQLADREQQMAMMNEELRQNLEELSATQEQLVASKNAIEQLKAEEAARAREVMDNQKRLMDRALKQFKDKELKLKEELAEKDARLKALEAQLTTV